MGRWRGRGRGGGGRSEKSRTLKRDFREPRKQKWNFQKKDWDELIKENKKYEDYYKAQGVVPEGEWEEFLKAMKRPLPVTFRVNGRGKFAEALKAKVDEMCNKPEVEGQEQIVPKCLPWYPGGMAYSVLASRKELRRDNSLSDFHEFLKRETEDGSMSRQEAVSMIPPLFLDVKPEHTVLDMCASPGSKTFQMLEMMHVNPEKLPTGFLIANDLDYQRCNLLTHQIKRMCSPNIVITSHDGTRFPNRKHFKDERVLSFDRILCDVPCTGDGTLRKSPDIWAGWTVKNGNSMHIQQLRITLKACQALKVGGRLVYSTCSLNPIEDEAVVAEVIRRTEGAMQLVDVSDKLPELKRMPGLKTWKVFDPNRSFENYEEVKKVRNEGGFKLIMDETFFPDEASDKMPLERCMRVLPHHQDTGGFFIAVLELVKELPKIKFPTADHRWEGCERRPEWRSESRKTEEPSSRTEGETTTRVDTVKEDMPSSEPAKADPGPMSAMGENNPEGVQSDDKDCCSSNLMAVDPGQSPAPEAFEDGKNGDKGDASMLGQRTVDGLKGDKPQEPETKQGSDAKEEGKKTKEEVQVTTQKGFDSGGDFMQIHKGIDPIIFLEDHPLVESVRNFFGIKDLDLGKHLISRMLKDGQARKIYFISESIRDLIKSGADHFLKMQAVGSKLLDRHEHKNSPLTCFFRFSQEGLPLVLKHITKRRLYVTVEDAIRLLVERSLPLPQAETQAESKEKPVEEAEGKVPEQEKEEKKGQEGSERPKRELVSDPLLLEQLEEFEDGGAIAMLRDSDAQALGLPLSTEWEGGLAANAPVALSCWRTRYRINVMVAKNEAFLLADKLRAKQNISSDVMDVEASRKRSQEDLGGELQQKEDKMSKLS